MRIEREGTSSTRCGLHWFTLWCANQFTPLTGPKRARESSSTIMCRNHTYFIHTSYILHLECSQNIEVLRLHDRYGCVTSEIQQMSAVECRLRTLNFGENHSIKTK